MVGAAYRGPNSFRRESVAYRGGDSANLASTAVSLCFVVSPLEGVPRSCFRNYLRHLLYLIFSVAVLQLIYASVFCNGVMTFQADLIVATGADNNCKQL